MLREFHKEIYEVSQALLDARFEEIVIEVPNKRESR